MAKKCYPHEATPPHKSPPSKAQLDSAKIVQRKVLAMPRGKKAVGL